MNKKEKILYILNEWIYQANISHANDSFVFKFSDIPKEVMSLDEARRIVRSIAGKNLVLFKDLSIMGDETVECVEIRADKFFLEFVKEDYVKKSSNRRYLSVTLEADGNLYFQDKVISDLTPLQKDLCELLLAEKPMYNFKCIDIEDKIYRGEADKKRQDKLRKLAEKINSITKDKFLFSKWIQYRTESIYRTV